MTAGTALPALPLLDKLWQRQLVYEVSSPQAFEGLRLPGR